MGKAEVGTPKYVANRMKSRGLQRLRWYCQACERQMRDENGFRMHANSEPHHRQMMLMSQNPGKQIGEYSRQFKHDFLQLLRTAHGEKRVHVNHFYQEYIANKDHIHMNATHWKTLSEFARALGREGVCRVDQDEKGVYVAWIDNSPESLARQQAIRRKDLLERNDEERAQSLLRAQIEKAERERDSKEAVAGAETAAPAASDTVGTGGEVQGAPQPEKVKISFGLKPKPKACDNDAAGASKSTGFSMSMQKPKNVFAAAAAKPNVLKSGPTAADVRTPSADAGSLKRMSGALSVLQEEERRKQRDDRDRDSRRPRPY